MFDEIQNEEFSPEVDMKNKDQKALSFEAKDIMAEDVKTVESILAVEDVPAEVEEEAVEVEVTNAEPRYALVVKVDNLRIRSTPEAASNNNVLFTIPRDTKVVILGEPEGDFIKVSVPKDGGYVDGYAMLSFLQMM